jgi:7-carboxy-7-deazaguanine synthase
MKQLEICEIFYSLQGESSYMGMPCVFVRLARCNLRCSFCDTRYSYCPGVMHSFEDILQNIRKYPANLVELTGGEPLLQEHSPAFMQELLDVGYKVLLETNGSIYIDEVPREVVKILDVKCPGSAHGDSFQLHNLKLMAPWDELKFVLTGYHDYQFALDFVRKHRLEGRKIHFSPVCNMLSAEQLAKWMLADGAPAKLSLQLHKQLNLR